MPLSASRVLTAAKAFLQVEGPDNDSITVDGGDLAKAGGAWLPIGTEPRRNRSGLRI